MADQDEAPALRNGASSNGHFSIISGIVYLPEWESVLYRADIALMKMNPPMSVPSRAPVCLSIDPWFESTLCIHFSFNLLV